MDSNDPLWEVRQRIRHELERSGLCHANDLEEATDHELRRRLLRVLVEDYPKNER